MKITLYKDCTTLASFNKVKRVSLSSYGELFIRLDNSSIKFQKNDYDWFEVEEKK